jgi:hypothetical protein
MAQLMIGCKRQRQLKHFPQCRRLRYIDLARTDWVLSIEEIVNRTDNAAGKSLRTTGVVSLTKWHQHVIDDLEL